MKRSYVALLTTVASLGLLLGLLCAISSRSEPTLAAPPLEYAFSNPLRDANPLSYLAVITCTLATTTTDSLAAQNNYTYTNAVALADYTGLALSTGDKGASAPAEDDWFRLDNATVGSIYQVEAFPDKTNNYNLGIVVYDAGLMQIDIDEDTSNNSASITLQAGTQGPYYFKVYQVSAQCSGETYHLDFSITPPTPSPSATPSPWEDNYEQNDSFDQAYTLPVATSVTLEDLAGLANFYPVGDEDWFKFWAKNGKWYQATTSDLSGVDTYLEIRNQNNSLIKSDDDGGGGYASQARWQAGYDGYYYIRLTNKVQTTGSYDLTIVESDAPAPDASPTPAPGAHSEADSCEDNLDFVHACVIPVNQAQTFNLIPPYGGVDNDFYKVWVKPGFIFECATSDLAPGVDTNMIVFTGPSWENAIGGNDDREPGDYNSYFSYYATYEGWLYLLLGTGDRTPSNVYSSNYTLLCDMHMPGQTSTPGPKGGSTPAPTSDAQTATPAPTGSPAATSTPAEVMVRPLTTPTPVPDTTPAPRFIPISLLVYYDANDDHQPGAGEGIAGVSAQAYEAAINQLLAQGFTDEQGNLEFTVAAQGPVRISVPFFGFSQLVAGEGASIYLRVPPQTLPGGAP